MTTTIRLEKLNRHSLGGGLLSPTRRPSKCRWKWRVKPRAGGRGVYIPLAIVIETELEDVVDIWPGTLGTSASPLNFGGFSGKVGVSGH